MSQLVTETQKTLTIWRQKRHRRLTRAENLKIQQIDLSDELVQMFHSDQSFSEMNRTVKEIRLNKKNGIENTKVGYKLYSRKNEKFQKTIAKYGEKGFRPTSTIQNSTTRREFRKQLRRVLF